MNYITASKLYDYTQCPHRIWRDIYGPQEEKIKEINPFVELLWKRGIRYEEEVVKNLGDFTDLSSGTLEERFKTTKEAMKNNDPLIYQGVLQYENLLGIPDLLQRMPDGLYIPIEAINNRIKALLKRADLNNDILNNIQVTVTGLENGDMKECPKCKEVRKLKDFYDASLITSYGRFCKKCKSNKAGRARVYYEKQESKQDDETTEEKSCPTCSSTMVLRSGRYGKFYGCSKYPYCRGTRQYK